MDLTSEEEDNYYIYLKYYISGSKTQKEYLRPK